jgi:hypothetical protein
MEIAQKQKMVRDLEVPKIVRPTTQGMMGNCGNPFDVLVDPNIAKFAKNIGICIDLDEVDCEIGNDNVASNVVSISSDATLAENNVGLADSALSVLGSAAAMNSCNVISSSSFCPASPHTPAPYVLGGELDSALAWTKVSKIGRGKHPKKKCSQ